ncbi:type II and III secretion system protein family protein [Duganella sp. Root336D2]|uniref:type II and III secretion system protein family protein n=1 Tax=Duganella sp. Root336D2 TaxID=1736518 RepID=UPI0006F274F7|nr:type II and III secretion system protein family protein [Duganella sp. Root336D2]KQV46041.1 outer membrane channel protein [Duganella sp. Root336D2]
MKRLSTAVPSILGALLVLPSLLTPAAAQVGAEAAVVAQQPKMKAKGSSAPGKKADAALPPALPEGRTELAPAMQLAEGKSSIVRLQHPAARVAVGDARIADVILLNQREVYMLGRTVGTTNLIVWQKTGDTVIADLTVSADTATLQAGIDKLTGQAGMVKVSAAADSIMLSGTVPDVVMAEHVLQMANAFVTRQRPTGGGPGSGSSAPAGSSSQPAASGEGGISLKVINMLSVAAPQQVMLEVKVAEVSKSLVDQLGASIGLNHTIGNWTYTLLSNLLTGNPSLASAFKSTNGNSFTIDAQKRDGLVKMLAEPNLMAISGQEASFLAGGKIFIPVASTPDGGGFTRITLEEKEFGVAVRFTPTVLGDGRINLKVAPEVSELNKEGVGISASGVNGTAILPSFTTRRAATTVQLFDGQSFAIGGLIKNNTSTNIKAVPGLGEIPVLGALFRSNDFQTDRTELVFVITPHLVKPLPPDFANNLPTSNVTDPGRAERIFNGKMEGEPPQNKNQKQPAQKSGGFDLN